MLKKKIKYISFVYFILHPLLYRVFNKNKYYKSMIRQVL